MKGRKGIAAADDTDDDSSDDTDDSSDECEVDDDSDAVIAVAPLLFEGDDECTCVNFHNERDGLLAVGHVSGDITLHQVNTSDGDRGIVSVDSLHKLPHHTASCRVVSFSESGTQTALSVSSDKSLVVWDVESGKRVRRQGRAHKCGIYSAYIVTEHLAATGDEDGCVKLWDYRRSNKSVGSWKECNDYVSDMTSNSDRKILLATSGEGTLTAYDIRCKKMLIQSELFDAELLSIATAKNGSKIVCGSSDGVLQIFNWSEFSNISDRYPAISDTIDCMVPSSTSNDIIFMGCGDGTIRAAHILPNFTSSPLPTSSTSQSILSLSVHPTSSLLASCDHSNIITFHHTDALVRRVMSRSPAAGGVNSKRKTKAPARVPSAQLKKKQKRSNMAATHRDFFSDL